MSCGAGSRSAAWRSSRALATLITGLLDPRVGAVVAGTCLMGLGAYLLTRAGAGRGEQRSVAARAQLSERVVETTQVADELLMWQAGERAVTAVAEASDEVAAGSVRSARWLGLGRAIALSGCGTGVASVALLTAPAVTAGHLGAPLAALLVLVPLALGEVVVPVVDAGTASARARAAESRLTALLSLTPAVTAPATPADASDSTAVEVSGVTASWDDRPALRDLSLSVPSGRRVGIVGPSGSGKSTLAALFLRFVDPVEGSVRLGGVELPRLALDDVRRSVGLVDDDPHVFATTVAENVRLARPSASDDDIEEALRDAGLAPWLDGPGRRARHATGRRRSSRVRWRAGQVGRGPVAPGRPAGARARRADRSSRPRDGGAAGRPDPGRRQRSRGRLDHPRAGRTRPPGRRRPPRHERRCYTYPMSEAPTPIRVFLLDDHEVVRQGLRALLESGGDIEVVGESGLAAEAAARIPALRPHVAVLDARLPDGSGIEVCRTVRGVDPDIKALILTSYDDDEALFAAIMAGAAGYVLKEITGQDLIGAVRQVAAGNSLIDPVLTARVLERVRNGPGTAPELAGLTEQELKLLALIAEGLTNRQIGERMFLAEKTVKNYVSSILAKLGLERRTQAAVLASKLLGQDGQS